MCTQFLMPFIKVCVELVCSIWYVLIRLAHLQCESLLFQSPHLSVCLSRIISWKLMR